MTNPKYILFALTTVLLFTFSEQICQSNQCILDKDLKCNRENADFCGLRDASLTLTKDALYHCSNVGSAPTLKSNCPKCLTTKDQSKDYCEELPICQSNTCILIYKTSPKSIQCNRKNADFCGIRDKSGTLSKDALYHCSDVGSIPSLKSNCPKCLTTDDQSRDYCEGKQICNSNLCVLDEKTSRCNRENVDFCGLRDTSGKLSKDGLYHCSGLGSVPSLKSKCPKLCFTKEHQSIDYCEVPKTKSTLCDLAKGNYCGQRDSSGISASGTLYYCSAVGSSPILINKCPNNDCIISAGEGADHCAVPQNQSCICERGSGDFCGQRTAPYLTGSCVSGTLYHCTGAEIHANLKSHCPDHKCIASGDGGYDQCAGHELKNCTCMYGSGDFCGERPETYLTGNCVHGAIYHCSGMGIIARLKGICPNNDCRTDVTPSTDFCNGPI